MKIYLRLFLWEKVFFFEFRIAQNVIGGEIYAKRKGS